MREILPIITAGLIGLLFGLGLATSHMTDPAVIAGFLDITGDWNPSLLFVMIGAIAVALPAFVVAKQREKSLLGETMSLPNRFRVDRPLVAGAAIFGAGWGLAGICPGPGLVLLGTLDKGALVFVPAVIVGMLAAYYRAPQVLRPA